MQRSVVEPGYGGNRTADRDPQPPAVAWIDSTTLESVCDSFGCETVDHRCALRFECA